MSVPFKDLHALPCPVPVPKLYGHVVAGGEDERLGGVDDDRSDVVWMCFEGRDLLGGIVVVDS